MEYRNLALALLEHGKITTTLPRAKKARSEIERLVTVARRNDLAARRRLLSALASKDATTRFLEVSAKFAGRPGGYLRIVKLGPRKSDSAEKARLEWVDQPKEDKK